MTRPDTRSIATDAQAARRGPGRRFLTDPVAMTSSILLAIVVVLGLLSRWIAPFPPSATSLDAINEPPFSPGHLLGGDASGRDILSRLLIGTQQTLLACVIILVVSVVLGVTSGLIAGYARGPFESVANWAADILLSLPGLVLLIALYALTGPNLVAAMAAFGVLVAPSYFRLVRGIVIGVRGELYVDAAKVVGLSDLRIVGRHILWAVRAPVIIQSSFVLAGGIAIEAAVDFLGLGDPARPSWGVMLQESFGNVYRNGWAVVWPAALISLTILCLVLLGNALRDVLEPGAPAAAGGRRHRRELTAALSAPAGAVGPDDDAILSVRRLAVGYPVGDGMAQVVHGIDLRVRRGEIRGLVGESGSGKSQTAFSILGILPREAVVGGTVLLDGVDLLADPAAQSRARGRRIAYIPQEPMSNLDPSFTIGRQLVFGLRAVERIGRREARERILALLTRVGIQDAERVFHRYPHEISGGMAQRVLICGAVAGDPDVIIADEPTTALDVTVQAEVLQLLRELRDERGLAMILVTHNFGVVADLCDSVSVMRHGRVVESGPVLEIFRRPQHRYTRELLAATRAVELEEVG